MTYKTKMAEADVIADLFHDALEAGRLDKAHILREEHMDICRSFGGVSMLHMPVKYNPLIH